MEQELTLKLIELRLERSRLYEKINCLQIDIDKLQSVCDHKYSNGDSSIVSNKFFSQCSICMWNSEGAIRI